jgi:hypothetical protein
VVLQLNHTLGLLDFFEKCTMVAFRFGEHLQTTDNGRKYEIKSFIERYQTV